MQTDRSSRKARFRMYLWLAVATIAWSLWNIHRPGWNIAAFKDLWTLVRYGDHAPKTNPPSKPPGIASTPPSPVSKPGAIAIQWGSVDYPISINQFASVSHYPISISQFTSTPPDVKLMPHGNGARNGRLWLRADYSGLYVIGQVDGGQPEFPHSKSEMLSKDHIEVWLAGTPDLDLPEVGWGNQFQDEILPKGEESCADWASQQALNKGADAEKKCRTWAALQVRYRPYFKRLFLRQWLLAPDLAMESFATPAFDEIEKRFSNLGDKLPDLMKPRGKPQMFVLPSQAGYGFVTVIPYEAFPPLTSLGLDQLYLLVDIFSSASSGKKMGEYSTSSERRVYGKAETFNSLWLATGPFLRLTPCDTPLTESDKRGVYHAAWFLLPAKRDAYVSDTFIVVNDPLGYRYEPAGLSPSVRTEHNFWKELTNDEWVCGPQLTYNKGAKSESTPITVGEEGFDAKRLASGELLVKAGPRVWYSEFGSGQCGACPRTDLRIFELGTDMKFYQVLDLGETIGGAPGLSSEDFTVSPDWSEITDYRGEEDIKNLSAPWSWSSTTWCLKTNDKKDQPHSHVYEVCGQKDNVQPPNPPVLKGLDQEEKQ